MFADRRKLLIGGAGALALVLAIWWFWPASSSSTAGGAIPAARARDAATGAPRAVGPVKLDALNASREAPGQAPRNPFRFQPKVAPPPPRPAEPVTPAPSMIEAPRPSAPTGPPPPASIPLKLIGVLERANGVKWAVLSDGKSPPMYGKDGDIIDGRYTIVKIGAESVELIYVDGRGRQVIRLNGQ
jgi:hypothetical protein